MKKTAAAGAALSLMMSLSATAFAADTTIVPGTDGAPTPPKAETTVAFQVDPTYTVTIPKNVELTWKKDEDGTVTYERDAAILAENVRLENGKKIQVILDSDYTMSTGSAELVYTVTANGQSVSKENPVAAEFTTAVDDQSVALHFKADDPEYAGSYSDTVTFTLRVVDSVLGGDEE